MAAPSSKLPKAVWQLAMHSGSSKKIFVMMCMCYGPVPNHFSLLIHATHSQHHPSDTQLASQHNYCEILGQQPPPSKRRSTLKTFFSSGLILIQFDVILVLCTPAQVVLAQMKVRERFKAVLPLKERLVKLQPAYFWHPAESWVKCLNLRGSHTNLKHS